jgi:hypothetical protein
LILTASHGKLNNTESGGMINFVVRDNKLRFTINLEAINASGLEVSSRLLRLAVRPDGSD